MKISLEIRSELELDAVYAVARKMIWIEGREGIFAACKGVGYAPKPSVVEIEKDHLVDWMMQVSRTMEVNAVLGNYAMCDAIAEVGERVIEAVNAAEEVAS